MEIELSQKLSFDSPVHSACNFADFSNLRLLHGCPHRFNLPAKK